MLTISLKPVTSKSLQSLWGVFSLLILQFGAALLLFYQSFIVDLIVSRICIFLTTILFCRFNANKDNLKKSKGCKDTRSNFVYCQYRPMQSSLMASGLVTQMDSSDSGNSSSLKPTTWDVSCILIWSKRRDLTLHQGFLSVRLW